jgi:hypothetical protein
MLPLRALWKPPAVGLLLVGCDDRIAPVIPKSIEGKDGINIRIPLAFVPVLEGKLIMRFFSFWMGHGT